MPDGDSATGRHCRPDRASPFPDYVAELVTIPVAIETREVPDDVCHTGHRATLVFFFNVGVNPLPGLPGALPKYHMDQRQ